MREIFTVFFIIIILVIIGMFIGAVIQERDSDINWKKYLAKEGMAYYAVDAKTGETKMFFFNTNIIVDRKGALSKKVEK